MASKGALYPLNQLKVAFESLLKRGCEDGYLIITPQGTKSFIQFSKYILGEDNFGIELSFPKAEWSINYFELLKEYCESEGIKYEINFGSDSMEFLDVDFKKDIDKANDLTMYIVKNIFKIKNASKCHVFLNNAELC